MSYSARTYVQDSATGRSDVILGALAEAGNFNYDAVDVAVAYATREGVRRLSQRLVAPKWEDATKRWLISIDFGITEPGALKDLMDIPNSEVRVPNAYEVLSDVYLRPKVTFHTKAYLFRVDGANAPAALVVGSANLSANALIVGAESVVSQSWTQPLTEEDNVLLNGAVVFREWFDQAWARADPAAWVVQVYRSRFRASRQPGALRDEDTVVTAQAITPTAVGAAGFIAAMAAADGLWVQTHNLYANLGAGNPGNQLDAPRGSRVFFGFTSAAVPRNHQFGTVYLQVPGYDAIERGIRFGDNQMDKVNLPSPGVEGPLSYDDSYLLFERAGMHHGTVPLFRLHVLDHAGLVAVKQGSRFIDMAMQGGRQYGLIFR